MQDYATIMLVDGRYTRKEITDRLPRWIGASMKREERGYTFGDAFGAIQSFFQAKKAQQLLIEAERRKKAH